MAAWARFLALPILGIILHALHSMPACAAQGDVANAWIWLHAGPTGLAQCAGRRHTQLPGMQEPVLCMPTTFEGTLKPHQAVHCPRHD